MIFMAFEEHQIFVDGGGDGLKAGGWGGDFGGEFGDGGGGAGELLQRVRVGFEAGGALGKAGLLIGGVIEPVGRIEPGKTEAERGVMPTERREAGGGEGHGANLRYGYRYCKTLALGDRVVHLEAGA